MCCLDKENSTCCCGCSLTTGTWILGVLIIIEMVFSFITTQWLSAFSQLILVVPFVLTMTDKHNVSYRKWLYYIYVAGIILWLIAMVIVFIVWCVYTDDIETQVYSQCATDPNLRDYFGYNVDDCASSLRKAILITVCVCTVFGLLINYLFARMLYYGWMEQVEHQKNEGSYQTIVEPQQTPGYYPVQNNQMP